MPSVKIRFLEPLSELTGKRELDIQANEGSTLSDILTELGRCCGEAVKGKLLAYNGNLHPYVLASVNGTDIRQLNGINTRLKDGDGISIGLQITGG